MDNHIRRQMIVVLILSIIMASSLLIYILALFGHDVINDIKYSHHGIISISSAVTDKCRDESVYVDELNRSCKIIDAYTYYDYKTNCYFKYDVNKCPSQWVYYYVGFSDKYNDPYGWMVYNKYNNRWTINVANKTWDIIDSETEKQYDFWHFKNAYVNNIVKE